MPYFNFDYSDGEDSGGPTPLSWRFGKYLRWHPDLDFLYEVRINGELVLMTCLRFTEEEEERLIVRPHHQNPENPPPRIADGDGISDNLPESKEQN